jgi:UDP-2,4-diacetamido-2,4,6-trideoxy-beta-L-altropyranose hydrolase
MKKRVVFRADGNLKIGYGHFIRSLGIAGIIKDEFECIFATKKPTTYQITEIKKNCSGFISLVDMDNNKDEFLTYLKQDDIVVLDDYHFTTDYQLQIKQLGCKVVFIDDHNDKNYVCDALINNIPGFLPESFKKKEYTKLYLGTDYALLRKEFLNAKWRKMEKNSNGIFISFGGADTYNISEKIIKYLNAIDSTFEINLLIGDAYNYLEELKGYKNLIIHKNLSAAAVAMIMAKSYICIVPASSLLNEAASVGSKILVGYFADNQIQPYNFFVNNDLAIGLEDYRTLDFELFKIKWDEVVSSDFLIENQYKIYNFQQGNNLKKIFYDL